MISKSLLFFLLKGINQSFISYLTEMYDFYYNYLESNIFIWCSRKTTWNLVPNWSKFGVKMVSKTFFYFNDKIKSNLFHFFEHLTLWLHGCIYLFAHLMNTKVLNVCRMFVKMFAESLLNVLWMFDCGLSTYFCMLSNNIPCQKSVQRTPQGCLVNMQFENAWIIV